MFQIIKLKNKSLHLKLFKKSILTLLGFQLKIKQNNQNNRNFFLMLEKT